MTPESPASADLVFEQISDRVRFSTPEFLVYGVARVHLTPGAAKSRTTSTRIPAYPRYQQAARVTASQDQRGAEDNCGATFCEHAH